MAVELNLGPRPAKEQPRDLQVNALQAPVPLQIPGEPLRNVEFVGIKSKRLTSKVYALPLKQGAPYTVSLAGSGILHVFEGVLRYQETASRHGELKKGDTMLLRGKRPVLVAAAESAGSSREEGKAAVRFQWVEVHSRKAPPKSPTTAPEGAPPLSDAAAAAS